MNQTTYKQMERLEDFGQVTITNETMRVHFEALNPQVLEDLKVTEEILFIAEDFPKGIFVAVKKQGIEE